jgi:hypothetical protein
MKAYVIPSGVTISPFGDPPGKVRVLNELLADRRKRLLAGLGIETVDAAGVADVPAGSLVIGDHVFFTRKAMAAFLKAARGVAGDAVLTLPDCAFCREKRPLQDDLVIAKNARGEDEYRFAVFLMRSPAASLDELRARATPAVIPLKEKVRRPPNLDVLGARATFDVSYAFTLQAVQHVCHWSHILDVHLQALAERWLDVSVSRVLFYLGRALTAFSFNKWKIARRLVYKGKGCDIHPSAVVEASILGDRVRIGPHAVVRFSVIGSDVKIDEHSEVLFSAVADRCVCSFRGRINFTVVYPRALVSQPAVQICVVGEGAVHTVGVFPIDMKLDFRRGPRDVPVLHHGRVVPSGKKFLGACIGHGAIVGTGLWLICGIEIPNGAFLVRDPGNVVTRVPDGFPPGEPLTLRAGTAVPVRSLTGPGKDAK